MLRGSSHPACNQGKFRHAPAYPRNGDSNSDGAGCPAAALAAPVSHQLEHGSRASSVVSVQNADYYLKSSSVSPPRLGQGPSPLALPRLRSSDAGDGGCESSRLRCKSNWDPQGDSTMMPDRPYRPGRILSVLAIIVTMTMLGGCRHRDTRRLSRRVVAPPPSRLPLITSRRLGYSRLMASQRRPSVLR